MQDKGMPKREKKYIYTRKINMAAVIGMVFLFGTRYIPRPRFDCTKVCRVLKVDFGYND